MDSQYSQVRLSAVDGLNVVTRPFAEFVAAEPPHTPALPAAHTLDGWGFRKALRSMEIVAEAPCDVYGELLTYLFYGRPAYRGHGKDLSSSLASLSLVAFILDPATLPPLVRVMPFDTGAFNKPLFLSVMHPKMQLADFELAPELAAAGQVVTRFYGDNDAYWRGRARTDLTFTSLDFEAQSFAQLIASKASTTYDDRRSAIELHVQSIDLRKTRVLAIILPDEFADDQHVRDFAAAMSAERLAYTSYHARQIEDARAIVDQAEAFLRARGYL